MNLKLEWLKWLKINLNCIDFLNQQLIELGFENLLKKKMKKNENQSNKKAAEDIFCCCCCCVF